MKNVLVWDLPLRLFHWVLVIAASAAFVTALVPGFQDTALHMRCGYVLLFLILFRIIWGIVGTTYARFPHFVHGPRVVLAYISRDLFARSTGHKPGHNPLGGWMIILMLLALILQITTGLFANDDIMNEGPLAYKLSADASSLMTAWHKKIYYVVGFLILLHLIAIGYHTILKRQKLVMPMFTGRRVFHADAQVHDTSRTNWWYAIGAVLIALALVYFIVEWL